LAAFELVKDAAAALSHIRSTWPAATSILEPAFYDPTQMMAGVLRDAYTDGTLSYVVAGPDLPGHIARSDGPCTFCVNDHWKFPLGCPYGKPDEPQLAPGLLDRAAAEIVKAGAQVPSELVVRRMVDDGFEAARGPDPRDSAH
jgi:hypothetical protein